MKIAPYWKTVVAATGAVIYAVEAAVSDGDFTSSEIVGVVLAALVVLGVYRIPNQPSLSARREIVE